MFAVQVALRLLFGVLGAAAIVISCRMNYAALAAVGGPNAQYIAAVAVMTAAVKAGVPVYADYFKIGRRGLWGVFALAVGFDVLCVLGFAAMTRGAALDAATGKGRAVSEIEATIRRHDAASASADAEQQSALARARSEFDRLADVSRALKYAGRPSAVIAPAIEAQRARAGDCSSRGHVDACQALQRLLAEEQDAIGREAAARRMDAEATKLAAFRRGAAEKGEVLRAQLSKVERPAEVIDPAAYAMREVLALAGFNVPEAWAGKVFNGVLVLLIELLAVLGLKAAFHPAEVTPRPTPQPEAPPAPAPTAPPSPYVAPVPAALVATPAIYLPRSPAADELTAWLEGQGGAVTTSYRKVGAALGMSASAALAAARQLEQQGCISITATSAGTVLKSLSRQSVTQNAISPRP